MILGITTAPRPEGVSYLARTIASALNAGFRGSGIGIYAEPKSDGYSDNGVATLFNESVLGNYGNFRNMAEHCSEIAWDGELIITAEDDIEFCDDAARKISEAVHDLPKEDFGFFAVYSASCHQEHLQPDSIATLKTTSLWGACCLAWTRESLRALLSHRIFKEWRGLDDNRPSIGSPKIKHVDTCISQVMDKLNRKMYFCRPSLVRHIGEVSTLRKKAWTKDRDCQEFAGDQN